MPALTHSSNASCVGPISTLLLRLGVPSSFKPELFKVGLIFFVYDILKIKKINE